MKPLTARELILALIDSATGDALSARYFVSAGALFDLDAGSIRTALARLVQDGSLRQAERGMYSRASRGGTLNRLVRNWQHVERSLKHWRSDWIAVFTQHLSRRQKTLLRNRARAMRLYGFAEQHPGFWLRPANLTMDTNDLLAALRELGLDDGAYLGIMSDLAPGSTIDVDALWSPVTLEAGYRDQIARLAESREKLDQLVGDEAAREALLVGRAVTREILLDPLLPGELVDADLRQQMIRDMQAYDRLGKKLWRAFYRARG